MATARGTSPSILGDLGTDLTLAREEWQENRAFCAYCQAATLLSAVSAAVAVPDAVRAVRTRWGHRPGS